MLYVVCLKRSFFVQLSYKPPPPPPQPDIIAPPHIWALLKPLRKLYKPGAYERNCTLTVSQLRFHKYNNLLMRKLDNTLDIKRHRDCGSCLINLVPRVSPLPGPWS